MIWFEENLMHYWLLIIFLAAIAAPWIFRLAGSRSGWIMAVVPATVFLTLLNQIPAVADGRSLTTSWIWISQLDLAFSLRLDGLGLLFGLLVTGIGTVVLTYAGAYLADDRRLGLLLLELLLFMGSMLGLVIADNLLTLFVFWELTSITSYLLIGFNSESPVSRASALKALLVTGGGGLALLPGLILLGIAGGTFEISSLAIHADTIKQHSFYLPALLLILVGAFTKSAQFPFHFWLPGAMAAPTPISAYLHSATMVKAGVYLLLRLHGVLGGTPAWFWWIVSVGAITTMVGAAMSLRSVDLKQILAYATVSVLGTLTMLVGIGSEAAIQAALALLVAHALYKGGLFLVAGAIDHAVHDRDIRKLGGLRGPMPKTFAAATLTGLSMIGLVPMFGFVAKELYYESLLASGGWVSSLLTVAISSNVMLFVAAGLVCIKPFFGAPTSVTEKAQDGSVAIWGGPLILGLVSLLIGAFPGSMDKLISAASLSAMKPSVFGDVVSVNLALWHGMNTTLLLSLLTLALGAAFLAHWIGRLDRDVRDWKPLPLSAADGYEWLLKSVNQFARWQTSVLQNGYLGVYLLTMIAATVASVWMSLYSEPLSKLWGFGWDVEFHEAMVIALILAAALSAVTARTWLLAVGSLGVVGYGVAILFVLFGAPDVAMTQFVTETLTVILFVIAFSKLPDFRSFSKPLTRYRDAVVALITGGTITVLLLFAMSVRSDHPISAYYAENSVTEAHGRNLVNVILVDFRALDTLGEITVLAIAAIGVYALLTLRKDRCDGVRHEGTE
ncbi:Na(+)/H(+) antiporter subunit A [Novipirellula aureliae]|uniref:Na(+)/H(+) antiporter subunit A n=1 Tax=Novipirellula aureliae TaxID=2527966 RepID=A0A5C6ECU9_9BACT|nr:putative monovalent cation/H+ antiporter subunit A [Novipirellula aureliae]TWU45019.1 Na(+)/H(+) antiporter subunit A [Novipirellula aureliae]